MTPTDPEHALLRAVLDAPDDDLPRLAYADLLEERGEDVRAEFVRESLLLAASGLVECPSRVPGPGGVNWHLRCGRPRCPFCRHAVRLDTIYAAFPPDVAMIGGVLPFAASHTWEHWGLYDQGRGAWPHLYVRRGFVERVEMPTDAFLAHAKALFSRHPVTEVVLADREPYGGVANAHPSWSDGSRVKVSMRMESNLPGELYQFLSDGVRGPTSLYRDYPDRAAALADLSRACVRHGRAEAGLGEWEGVRR